MFGEGEKLAHDQLDDALAILRLAILDNVLSDVVAVLVGNEDLSRGVELAHDLRLVALGAMLEQPLDDPAAVGVRGQGCHLSTHSVHDEVNVLSRHQLNDLLHNMVAVLVLDDAQDLGFQLPCQCSLLLNQDVLQGLTGETQSAKAYAMEWGVSYNSPFELHDRRRPGPKDQPPCSSSFPPKSSSEAGCHTRKTSG